MKSVVRIADGEVKISIVFFSFNSLSYFADMTPPLLMKGYMASSREGSNPDPHGIKGY